jgi:alkylated DNA repair dioxygenase AlkB
MKIQADDALLYYFPNFIKQSQSYQLLNYLEKNIVWQQDKITLFQQCFNVPRLQALYTDEHLSYRYSGMTLSSNQWLPALDKLKVSLNLQCQEIIDQPVMFNAVLANLYRDQHDSVAWHSDDEPELGKRPIIASVSLGATREFKLKHKTTGDKLNIPLISGSLLLMAGNTQQYWQHAILKSKKTYAQRINLTFREIKVA